MHSSMPFQAAITERSESFYESTPDCLELAVEDNGLDYQPNSSLAALRRSVSELLGSSPTNWMARSNLSPVAAHKSCCVSHCARTCISVDEACMKFITVVFVLLSLTACRTNESPEAQVDDFQTTT